MIGGFRHSAMTIRGLLCCQLPQEGFRNFFLRKRLRDDVVGGICTAHYWFSFVEIEPNPMLDWHNATVDTDSDADELAFLIGLLL